MKRLMKVIAAVLIVFMYGCSKYISHYSATGFVHSNGSSSAFMNFYSFNGAMVFRLKSKGEGQIHYTASLESGNATVYYDFYGTKTELFSIGSNEELESSAGYVEAGTVYLIVETDGKCRNGEFRFSME